MACCLETEEPFQISLPETGETTSKVVSLVTSLPLIRRGTTRLEESLEACVPLLCPFVVMVAMGTNGFV